MFNVGITIMDHFLEHHGYKQPIAGTDTLEIYFDE